MVSNSIDAVHKRLNDNRNGTPEQLAAILSELETALVDPKQFAALSEEKQQIVQRDALEVTALMQLRNKNVAQFNKTIAAVLQFYDSSCAADANTPNKWLMTGLYLMSLLADDRLVEFHMAVERINRDVVDTNAYIAMPRQLEHHLNVGFFNRIQLAKQNLPSPDYVYFIDQLLHTVRQKLGVYLASSYEWLSVNDTAQHLLFESHSTKDAIEFGKKAGWVVKGDRFYFKKGDKTEKQLHAEQNEQFNAAQLASSYLKYASQLENIV